jgi:Domain of unknown function (DUF4431)
MIVYESSTRSSPKKMRRLLLIAGALSVLTVNAASQCLDYEPSVVVLSGTIVRRTFPGPPNYESVAHGDSAELVWILRLTRPICVNVADHYDVHEDRQKELQLVLKPEFYKRFSHLVGNRVTARGTLFHAFTGHHHKKLLLTVAEIRKDFRTQL